MNEEHKSPNGGPNEEDSGMEHEAVEQVLSKFEKTRDLQGFLQVFLTAVAVITSCYHLYYAYFHPYFALDHRVLHWFFMSIIIFMRYPFSKKLSPAQRPSVFDWLFLLLSCAICLWIFVNSTEILRRAGMYPTFDVVMATAMILIVLEACRRTTGFAVSCIAIIFIGYVVFGPYLPSILAHKAYGLDRLSPYLSLSTDGIFGVPLGVSANFILLFILYGALLRLTGAGQFFTDIAFALTGWSQGGPAKAAVASSTFFGMISGSSVANTVTTGSFTIPLMKRTGYTGEFAAGVESCSSTMGQIMPPIMGAAAFIMAEFLRVPYIEVCLAALIPAFLAFGATFMQVHFRAVALDIKGIPRSELPTIKGALARGWHHMFSIFLLIYFLARNFSPERAVFWAIITTVVSSFIMCLVRNESLKEFGASILQAFKEGALGTAEVSAACAAAGIIIGSITMSGLGIKFSSLVVDASMGHLYLALPLTMFACIFLGMGVPTTAQYVIISSLVAPALTQMGVVAIAAHLFVLYFGTRADITPPVALAAYAGAGVARADPMKSGFRAFQLGIAGFIIPYMFVYAPELLLIGSPLKIGLACLTAGLGIYCLAAGVQACMLVISKWYETGILLAVALLMIKPGLLTDSIGIPMFLAVLLSQWLRRRKLQRETSLSAA